MLYMLTEFRMLQCEREAVYKAVAWVESGVSCGVVRRAAEAQFHAAGVADTLERALWQGWSIARSRTLLHAIIQMAVWIEVV